MDQLLSQASAFNPGCDLWITADPGASRWALKIDWCLNFQILRGLRHTPVRAAESLVKTVKLTELDWIEIPAESGEPLLVAGGPNLPARWVACLPYENSDLPGWVTRIEKLWSGLGRPSLKVFLPTGLAAGTFTETWRRLGGNAEISLVLDQEPQMK